MQKGLDPELLYRQELLPKRPKFAFFDVNQLIEGELVLNEAKKSENNMVEAFNPDGGGSNRTGVFNTITSFTSFFTR